MNLPPDLAAQAAAEHQRRSANWLGLVPDLCGVPSRALTPRHVLELSAAGNAFFAGRRALWGDVFDVLWRLHPGFYRPASPRRYLNWPLYIHLRNHIRKLVRTHQLFACEDAIRQRIRDTYLDAPGGPAPDTEADSPLTAVPHWLDSMVDFVAYRYGNALGHPLDVPITQIHQLRRTYGIAHGESIIDPLAERITTARTQAATAAKAQAKPQPQPAA